MSVCVCVWNALTYSRERYKLLYQAFRCCTEIVCSLQQSTEPHLEERERGGRRQTDRQDRQKERQTDRQKDRQTERQKEISPGAKGCMEERRTSRETLK